MRKLFRRLVALWHRIRSARKASALVETGEAAISTGEVGHQLPDQSGAELATLAAGDDNPFLGEDLSPTPDEQAPDISLDVKPEIPKGHETAIGATKPINPTLPKSEAKKTSRAWVNQVAFDEQVRIIKHESARFDLIVSVMTLEETTVWRHKGNSHVQE